MNKNQLITSESVTEGHPDKICDQVSDAILDAIISSEKALEVNGYIDQQTGIPASVKSARCACECYATTGLLVIGGEIRSSGWVDIQKIARDKIREIGYDRAKYGFDADTCGIVNVIQNQSPDIAQGVDGDNNTANGLTDEYDLIGAGDQGMQYGYATNETRTLMPMPHYLASRMAEALTKVRKDGTLGYLRPDGKTQVTVEYVDDKPVRIDTVVVSTQHDPKIEDMSLIKRDMIEYVIKPVLDANGYGLPDDDRIFVNPTGKFTIGGPHGDTGLTGRKIVVDTYGGVGRVGGGAFSGKDPTKVDRSAAYYARYVAKNIVSAGLAERCEVQVAYAIGVAKPVSVHIDTFRTNTVPVELIEKAVSDVFDFRPGAIIDRLGLWNPIYGKTSAYGHFGRELPEFTWEQADKVDELRDKCGFE